MDSKKLIKIGVLSVWSIVTVLIVLLFINNPTEQNVTSKVGGIQEKVTKVLELKSLSNNLLVLDNKYGVQVRELDLKIDGNPVTINDFYTEGNYLVINLSTLGLDSSVEHEIKIIIEEGNYTQNLSLPEMQYLTGVNQSTTCGDKICSMGEECSIDCPIELFCNDGADNNQDGLIDEAQARCQECGNGLCESFEDCDSCPSDCLKSYEVCCNAIALRGDCCSTNDCGGTGICEDNLCVTPTPTCGDGVCNNNETCTTCPSDCLSEGQVCCNDEAITGDCCNNLDCNSNQFCANNTCVNITQLCGNGICDFFYEDCSNCAIDCLNSDEVCCNGVSTLGDCCNDSDCNGTDFCYQNTCYNESYCFPNWSCTNWNNCSIEGTQTRTCNDLNECGTNEGKPSEEQSCTPNRKLEYTYSYNNYTKELSIKIENQGLETLTNGAITIKFYNDSLGTATYDSNLINNLETSESETINLNVNEAHTKIGYWYEINYTFLERNDSDLSIIPNPYNVQFKEYEYDSILEELRVLIKNIGDFNISPCKVTLKTSESEVTTMSSELGVNEEANLTFNVPLTHETSYTVNYSFEGFNEFNNIEFTPNNPYNAEVIDYSYVGGGEDLLEITAKSTGQKDIPANNLVHITLYNEIYGDSGPITYLLTKDLTNEEQVLPFDMSGYTIEKALTYQIEIDFPGSVVIKDEFTI